MGFSGIQLENFQAKSHLLIFQKQKLYRFGLNCSSVQLQSQFPQRIPPLGPSNKHFKKTPKIFYKEWVKDSRLLLQEEERTKEGKIGLLKDFTNKWQADRVGGNQVTAYHGVRHRNATEFLDLPQKLRSEDLNWEMVVIMKHIPGKTLHQFERKRECLSRLAFTRPTQRESRLLWATVNAIEEFVHRCNASSCNCAKTFNSIASRFVGLTFFCDLSNRALQLLFRFESCYGNIFQTISTDTCKVIYIFFKFIFLYF